MTRTLCAVVLAIGFIAAASTNFSAEGVTVSTDLMKDWKAQKVMMLRIAEAMPGDKFDYKTTPPQRTFGEQILHVAGANVMLLLKIFGLTATAKPDVLKAIGGEQSTAART